MVEGRIVGIMTTRVDGRVNDVYTFIEIKLRHVTVQCN